MTNPESNPPEEMRGRIAEEISDALFGDTLAELPLERYEHGPSWTAKDVLECTDRILSLLASGPAAGVGEPPSDGAIYAAVSRRSMTPEEHDLMMRAMIASAEKIDDLDPAPTPAASPDWQVVPKEPTHEMLCRVPVVTHGKVPSLDVARKIYKAMLAAAPTSQTSSPDWQVVREALSCAIGHIEHMAAFITSIKAGYRFESLSDDMPGMRAALSAPRSPNTRGAGK